MLEISEIARKSSVLPGHSKIDNGLTPRSKYISAIGTKYTLGYNNNYFPKF